MAFNAQAVPFFPIFQYNGQAPGWGMPMMPQTTPYIFQYNGPAPIATKDQRKLIEQSTQFPSQQEQAVYIIRQNARHKEHYDRRNTPDFQVWARNENQQELEMYIQAMKGKINARIPIKPEWIGRDGNPNRRGQRPARRPMVHPGTGASTSNAASSSSSRSNPGCPLHPGAMVSTPALNAPSKPRLEPIRVSSAPLLALELPAPVLQREASVFRSASEPRRDRSKNLPLRGIFPEDGLFASLGSGPGAKNPRSPTSESAAETSNAPKKIPGSRFGTSFSDPHQWTHAPAGLPEFWYNSTPEPKSAVERWLEERFPLPINPGDVVPVLKKRWLALSARICRINKRIAVIDEQLMLGNLEKMVDGLIS